MGESGAGSSKKFAEEEFSPIGIRVLAVDDDADSLRELEKVLLSCSYKVTVTQSAITALQLLRENKGNYDIVISEVKMPEMDGFKLSEIIDLENMDLPVIMLSSDTEVETVMKGIKYGACDYLVKPAREEELKLIWKHVIKKSVHDAKGVNDATSMPNSLSNLEEDNTANPTTKSKDQTKENEEEANDYSDEDPSTQKRPRVSWTSELHSKFLDAISKLGLDRAVPNKILEHMDVPGITRENVASHLQKYRKAVKRNCIEFCKQAHGSVGPSGWGANTNSVPLPFNNQCPNVSSLEGFRVEGYQNHQRTIPFAPVQQSLIGDSHITPTWSPLPLSQQNNLLPYYPSTTQATANAIYQSLIPRLNQPSSFKDNSSQIQWLNEKNSSSNSVNQPGHVSNQQGVDSIFEHNLQQGDLQEDAILAGLKDLAAMQHQPHQFSAQTGSNLGLGIQLEGDSKDPNSDQKQLEGTSSLELLAQFLESSQHEFMFHLSDGDSADDLHSTSKQFQGSKKFTEGDNL